MWGGDIPRIGIPERSEGRSPCARPGDTPPRPSGSFPRPPLPLLPLPSSLSSLAYQGRPFRCTGRKTINTRPNHSTNKIKRRRETEMRLKRRDESRWKACKSWLRVGWNVTSRDRCVRTPDPTRGPASLAAAPTTRTTHVHLCDSRSPCLR